MKTRWCDRDCCAAWLEDDAEDVRVGKEGFRIVGPGQPIGHDVVEGIVAHAGIGVAGRIGDVAAKTEWRLELRALRRVREGTLIGWTVRLFVECPGRTTGRSAGRIMKALTARPAGTRVPAHTVLRTVRVAGTPYIVWKRPLQWEREAERFPVIAPDVRGGVGGAVEIWFGRVLVQPAIREAAHHIVPARGAFDEHPRGEP